MSKWHKTTLSFAALASLALCACTSPTVVQGSVVSRDEAGKSLVVKDENLPNAELVISTANAEIGAEPVPGDIVRVAYVQEGSNLRATRIMNVTRQREQRSTTSGGH